MNQTLKYVGSVTETKLWISFKEVVGPTYWLTVTIAEYKIKKILVFLNFILWKDAIQYNKKLYNMQYNTITIIIIIILLLKYNI